MPKLYTRTGDDGTTGLFGGGRVRKDHIRVEAYGCVDELNAILGMCISALDLTADKAGSGAPVVVFSPILMALQSRLFDLGADLATPADSPHADKIARIGQVHISQAETWIDLVDAGNLPMTQFILPGGSELAARLHLARTVCRRAERAMVTLARESPINQMTIVYVNRISDLLFAMARRANKERGLHDVPWVKG
jgi:cob(I)alamin adenosyltransferase